MKITAISFRFTKNMGNHESKTIEVTATIEEDENEEQALTILRQFVMEQLNTEPYDGIPY